MRFPVLVIETSGRYWGRGDARHGLDMTDEQIPALAAAIVSVFPEFAPAGGGRPGPLRGE